MMNLKLFLSFLPAVITAIMCNCSPVPMLQSPRVKSNFSIGTNLIFDQYYVNWFVNAPISRNYGNHSSADTINRCWDYNVKEPHINPYWVKFGIHKRVEIGGMVLPYLWYGYIINGNLKVFLFEHGSPSYFRNVSYALFGGGNATRGEWDKETAAYIGAIFGTRHSGKHQEIEFILQPSYYQQKLHSYPDDGAQEIGNIDGLQLNFGTIFTPYKTDNSDMEIVIGGVYRYVKKNDWKMVYDNKVISNVKDVRLYTRWVAQVGVTINFKRNTD